MTEERYIEAKKNRERLERTHEQLRQAKQAFNIGKDLPEACFSVIQSGNANPCGTRIDSVVLTSAMHLYILSREKLLIAIEEEFRAI